MKNIVLETKKHFIKVRVKGHNINYFLQSLFKQSINIYKINYLDNKTILIKIRKKDYSGVRKSFKSYKFRKLSDEGIYRFKPFLKRNWILITTSILGICLLFLMSNIIVKVEVIHSNSEIRKLVTRELEFEGVKRLTFKKSYKKLENIKQILLEKYPERLEWIEIEIQGMNYIVRVEERILTKPIDTKPACNIVAKKDAIITKIIAHDGETAKKVNNFVRKGDIIVSGNIHLNEAIKNTVCASGEVYGEVWYTANATVPLNYIEKLYTGRTKTNFLYESEKNKKTILRSRFEHYDSETKQFFSLFGTKFYTVKEIEYEAIPKVYSENEAIERGIKIAREKIMTKFDDNEYIISQKVLKKTVINSTMELEIFFAVNELISETEEFVVTPEVTP